MTDADCLLLPNLGAEEGENWRGYMREPATRVAARLWSHLFSRQTILRSPRPDSNPGRPDWIDRPVEDLWPVELGEPPDEPAYAWLESRSAAIPWLRNESIEAALLDAPTGLSVAGPSAKIVAQVHDKAFALEAARELDLVPESLDPLLHVIEPRELEMPMDLFARLEHELAQWPEWTGQRFTLKPRLGSSGRGRVAGVAEVDTASLRGALPRLAARGGAVFEPWLERCTDLSVCLHLPDGDSAATLPTLLGSLEMLATPSGVYRGHCGEIDHRGRVFSGVPEDETLRAQAAAIATRARARGYFGPCGVDAFIYREGLGPSARDRLRPAVEFNARPTMGLVALGLLRRALPRSRHALDLEPGDRRAFLLALLDPDEGEAAREIAAASGALGRPLRLSSPDSEASAPVPHLFFSRELEPLREAYRQRGRC